MKLFKYNNIKGILLLCLIALISVNCDKDEDTLATDDDPANSSGRFSDFLSCDIISVPSEVGLNGYYTKYINCSGIPVIGSDDVPDEALLIASETVEFMLTDLGNIRSKLISEGNYIALYPEGSSLNSLPENFQPQQFTVGQYLIETKCIGSDVSSLICNPEGPAGNILVHEIVHMMDIGALRLIESNFSSEQTALYNQSIASGKWNNTYASSNAVEWLAEGVTIWYGVNFIGPEGGDGSRNNIGTRAQLQAYDSGLYNLINTHYNNKTDVPGCRQPVIEGTTANCPAMVSDIDGNQYNIVNVGPMCFLKENLKTTKYTDGTTIVNITDDNLWQNDTTGGWSNFDNDTSNDKVYGKLYNSYALNNSKGICPDGWRVPTIQELQDLANYAGGDYASGNLMTVTLWDAPNSDATNSSGFSAVPSGKRLDGGIFQGLGGETFFGSSTLNDSNFYSKSIFANQPRIVTASENRNTGVSCRCIQE